MKRLRAMHVIVILLALAVLAAVAFWYSNVNDQVAGLPALPSPGASTASAREACAEAGGVWSDCASACPPGTENCIQMCVAKCVFPETGSATSK